MDKNQIVSTNQNTKLALSRSKNLLDITKNILKNNRQSLTKLTSHLNFHLNIGHANSVTSLAITPDGKHIVSGSLDRTIKIWDMKSGECINTLEGHTNSIFSLSITPDEKHIVSGSWDDTIKIWDFKSGECIYTIYYFTNNDFLSIDFNGYFSANPPAIDKYLRVKEAPLQTRKLTAGEIQQFSKKRFLDI